MYIQKAANEFVREYYTRLCNKPRTLHKLYASEAAVLRGNEGDSAHAEFVKEEKDLEARLNIDPDTTVKVRITDVTAVPVSESTASILVLGDMKIGENPAKMFVQSFVLHLKSSEGPLIASDILRYPKQEESGAAEPSTAKSADGVHADTNAVDKEKGESEENVVTDAVKSKSESAEPKAADGASDKPSTDSKSEKTTKGKKFKFSYDAIAKAPSFHPTNSVPAYPLGFGMNGYSPTYSPAAAYQTPHAMQIPFQIQTPMFHRGALVPPVHGSPQPGLRDTYNHDKYPANNH